jgi:hypothetical protein
MQSSLKVCSISEDGASFCSVQLGITHYWMEEARSMYLRGAAQSFIIGAAVLNFLTSLKIQTPCWVLNLERHPYAGFQENYLMEHLVRIERRMDHPISTIHGFSTPRRPHHVHVSAHTSLPHHPLCTLIRQPNPAHALKAGILCAGMP